MGLSLFAILATVCILGAYLSLSDRESVLDTDVKRTARQCRKRPFRTLSGRCTSTTNPTWGGAGIPYLSYIRNHSSVVPTGQNLKNTRVISNLLSVQTRDTVNAHGLNELWPYFALFLAHDIIDTPFKGPPMPIITPPNDPFLPPGIPIFFLRSERVGTGKGKNEEPVNRVSSAIDLSGVYGIDRTRNADVRVPGSAKLRTSFGNLLPLNTRGLPNVPDTSRHFYLAGDPRANESPVLLVMHILFLREHNRLVDEIRSRIPYLSTEKEFQYARTINIAQFQKIVFEEFYPALVSLSLPRYKGFRKQANPSISNVFAGAAGAVGPNMLGRMVPRKSRDRTSLPGISLEESINRNATKHPLTPSDVDNLIRGTAWTTAQEVDLQMHDGLRNVLTATPVGKVGFDLAAITLQRGRDQAIPTYNELRRLLRLKTLPIERISSDPQIARKLKAAYDGKAEDVEAWAGLSAEDNIPGSGVGITAALAWRREFTRLRDGDQFFYRRKGIIPMILRRKLPHRVRDIRDEKKALFRDLISRNSGVTDRQLPRGDIFRNRRRWM